MVEYIKNKNINQIKAVIFDLDGTLADTLLSIGICCNEALRTQGLGPLPIDDYRYYAGDGAITLVERAMQAAGAKDMSKLEDVFKIYSDFFKKDCTYKVTVFDGIWDVLKALKKNNIKIAVLSNKPHARTVDVIYKLFGEEVFDIVFGQKDDVPRKPAPDGALMIQQAFGVLPKECLYVGDTDVDMQTGNAGAMFTAGVLWGFRTREELIKHGADMIVEHPIELLEIIDNISNKNH